MLHNNNELQLIHSERLWWSNNHIKELSTKSRFLLEKGPAYQFNLSLLRLAFYYPFMEQKIDELHFLLYQENIDLCSWKYKF